jgi:hypothetical protein
MNDGLGEALVEHGVIEFGLYQANEALGADDFDFKCKVLHELVEHHVEEEEKEFFPKVEKAIDAEGLESLGEDMADEFEEARSEDFRGPLYGNLQQVFAGALKTATAEEVEEAADRVKAPSGKRKARKSA